jgi:hypothetical protein
LFVTKKAHPREGETSSTNKMKPRPCRPIYGIFYSPMSTTPWSMSILHRIVASDVLSKASRSKIVRHETGSPPRGKDYLDQQNETSSHADQSTESSTFHVDPLMGFTFCPDSWFQPPSSTNFVRSGLEHCATKKQSITYRQKAATKTHALSHYVALIYSYTMCIHTSPIARV